jgi:two-component system response regulator YesN
LKVLIVDDELIIRKGLIETVDWASLNVEIVGDASNGSEAMDILRQTSVDLVLTDIRMPFMDGLELVKTMKEEGVQGRVIMISGFNDFNYAREALRLGVQDYLLKPVDIDELIDLITKIQQAEHELRKEKLIKWFQQVLNASEGESFYNAPPKQKAGQFVSVVCSQLSDYYTFTLTYDDEQQKLVYRKWKQRVEMALGKTNVELASFFVHSNMLITLLSADVWEDELASMLRACSEAWEEPHGLYFSVSERMVNWEEEVARKAYRQAVSALIDSSLTSSDPVICCNGEAKSKYRPLTKSFKLIDQLRQLVQQPSPEPITVFVDDLFKEFKQQSYVLSEAANECQNMMVLLDQQLSGGRVKCSDNLQFLLIPDLHVYNSFSQLKALFLDDLRLIQEQFVEAATGSKHYVLMEKAKAYIEKNISQEIKASEVAEWLYVTPNYFSQVFNQEVGKNFKEYLNTLRIDKAKELLQLTNEKVLEIAMRVGYKDYKHFVYVFKNLTGVTPSMYREIVLKENQIDRDFV